VIAYGLPATLSVEIAQVATPLPLRPTAEQVAMLLLPFLKFTAPVGVPLPDPVGATVAVKVTV
jgi:hypothetical protein